jgi:hypothetical protein
MLIMIRRSGEFEAPADRAAAVLRVEEQRGHPQVGPDRRRRWAQQAVRSGSSTDDPPATIRCRTIGVQANRLGLGVQVAAAASRVSM